MKITTKSDDGKIECFYDSKGNKENFFLTIPNDHGYALIRINKNNLPGLVKALNDFEHHMKIATGR